MEKKESEFEIHFKEGIKDKTDWRAKAQVAGLRKKRKEKLGRRRIDPGTSSVAAPECSSFADAMQHYNKAAFMSGDLRQLDLLGRIVYQHLDADLLERHYDALFVLPTPGARNGESAPHVLRQLVQNIAFSQAAQLDVLRRSAKCLQNILSIRSHTHDAQTAATLLQAGYATVAAEHLERALVEANPYMDGTLHEVLWETTASIMDTCREARDDVLQSPLFGLAVEERFVKSPFFRILKGSFDNAQAPATLVPVLMCVVATALKADEVRLPPWAFVMGVWPPLVRSLLERVAPASSSSDLDESQRLETAATLLSLGWILRHWPHKEQVARLVAMAGPTALMRKLVAMFSASYAVVPGRVPVSNGSGPDRALRNRIVRILVELSAIRLEGCEFQQALQQAGGVSVMARALQDVDPQNPRLRSSAMLLVGNYAADGCRFVQELMVMGILKSIKLALHKDTMLVRLNAAYAIMAMFHACHEDYKRSMEERARAEGLMRALVLEHQMLSLLLPLLDRHQDASFASDILTVLLLALRWEHDTSMRALKNVGGDDFLNAFVNELSQMRGSQLRALRDLADQVYVLVDGKDDADDAEEEQRAFMRSVAHQQPGFCAPGVYEGGFVFGGPAAQVAGTEMVGTEMVGTEAMDMEF
jgi:hypothetical protein